MSQSVKFPEARIRLVGEDGNAYSIIARASRALRSAGATKVDVDAYVAEATSGDYNNLLITTMTWVSCDEDDDERCDFCGYLLDSGACECDEEEDE